MAYPTYYRRPAPPVATPPQLSVLPYMSPGARRTSMFAGNPSVVNAPYGFDGGGKPMYGFSDANHFGGMRPPANPAVGGAPAGMPMMGNAADRVAGGDARFFGPHIGAGPPAGGGGMVGGGGGMYDDRFFGPHIGGSLRGGAGAAAPAPVGSWMPAALQQQTPQYARAQARQAKVQARKMRRAVGGGGGGLPAGLNFSYTGSTMPPGAGTGGYYPGTSGEAQNQVRQNAVAAFQQYAQGKGLTPRQIQAATGQIAGGGSVGGGGGGGVGPQAGALFEAFQGQQNAANKANEDRYKDALAGYWDRYQRGLGNLTGMGQQEAADINEAARGQEAGARQSLVSRGLSNSTIMDNIAGGVERERRADQGRLQERLRNQLTQLDASLSGDVLGVMERREDVQPDYAQFLQLAQMLGLSGLSGGQVQQGGGGGGGMMLPPIMAGGGFGIPMGALGPMMPGAGAVSHRLSPGGYARMEERKRKQASWLAPWRDFM